MGRELPGSVALHPVYRLEADLTKPTIELAHSNRLSYNGVTSKVVLFAWQIVSRK